MEMEGDAENTASSSYETSEDPKFKWTIRKKLVLFTMCIAYFIALASVSIISPFFPTEVRISLEIRCFWRFFHHNGTSMKYLRNNRYSKFSVCFQIRSRTTIIVMVQFLLTNAMHMCAKESRGDTPDL